MDTNWERTEDHGLREFRKLQDLKCAPPIRDIRDIRGSLSVVPDHEWTRMNTNGFADVIG